MFCAVVDSVNTFVRVIAGDGCGSLTCVIKPRYCVGTALAEGGAVAAITRRSQIFPNDKTTNRVLSVIELMAGLGSLIG